MIRRPPRSTLLSSPTLIFFFFNDPATTEISTLSLHDALPIYRCPASPLPNAAPPPPLPTRQTPSVRPRSPHSGGRWIGSTRNSSIRSISPRSEASVGERLASAGSEGGAAGRRSGGGLRGIGRSEERRVGKEWRSRWSPDH